MRVERIGRATLYLADCLEVQVEHDLLVTDPPYGQQFESGLSNKWGPIAGDDDREAIHTRIDHALKTLRPSRHAYIFGGAVDPMRLPLGGMAELIWDKEIIGIGDLSAPWGPQHEKILFAVYIPSKANRERGDGRLSARLRKGSVLRAQRAVGRGVIHHPTEKPVEILRQMIESSSVMGETVYDPFMGSGSTLVAALIEGRKAIGCEIEPRYFDTACERVARVKQDIFA